MEDCSIKDRFVRAARLTLAGVHHLLWPAVCGNCRCGVSDEDRGLCPVCWQALLTCTSGDYCPRCGKDASPFGLLAGACADCRDCEIHFDGLARVGVYADSLQRMVLGFKKDRTELAGPLGQLADAALQGSGFYGPIDWLVPVPLHWTRRLIRGYNQSLLLARTLAHPTAGISTDLVRIRRTKFQPVMVSAAARKRNVAGAFAVRDGHCFEEKIICLVDDIKTTGATLNECAKTLKQAGAVKVYALVLAVAGQSRG